MELTAVCRWLRRCWKRLQSSIMDLSSWIITAMLIPPPHILLLQHHHHIKGAHDLVRDVLDQMSFRSIDRDQLLVTWQGTDPLVFTSQRTVITVIAPLHSETFPFLDICSESFGRKLPLKQKPVSDINQWDGEHLIRAVWLKVWDQGAPRAGQWPRSD